MDCNSRGPSGNTIPALTAALLAYSHQIHLHQTPAPNPPHLLLLTQFHTSGCLHFTSGYFWVCRTNSYICLPTNWTSTCTLVCMSPTLEFTHPDTPFPVPTQVDTQLRAKRAVQLVPLLVALGVTIGAGTGLAVMGISISEFSKLSKELTTDRLSTGPHGLHGCSGPTKLMWPRPAHSCTRRHLCPSGRTHCFFTSKSGLVQDGAQ
jgi:hypothetical protein